MIKKFLLLCITAIFIPVSLTAAPSQVIEIKILESLKKGEKTFQNYSFVSDLRQYKNEKQVNSAKFLVLVSGENAIAYYMEPFINKGKIILQKGSAYFLYFPKPKQYIRISAQANLFGNVSYSDLIKPPLLEYYQVTSMNITEESAEKETAKMVFTLKEGVRDFPFYKKNIVYDLSNNRIHSVQSFSRSDILLVDVSHLKFTSIQGVPFPVETVIHDIRSKDNYSIQSNSEIQIGSIPDRFFNPSSLRYLDAYLQKSIFK